MNDQPGTNPGYPGPPPTRYTGPPPTGYTGPPPTGYIPPEPVDPYAGGQVQSWGYPPPYPPPGYGMSMPGYPGGPVDPDRRPGTVTASAVLGYVNAGFLILMSVVLFSTNSIIDDLSRYSDVRNSVRGEFAADAFINLIAAGLLIAGGISMANRSALGRRFYSVGVVVVLAESVYWLARWVSKAGGSYLTPYPIMFLAVAIVGLSLAWFGAATPWLGAAPGRAR